MNAFDRPSLGRFLVGLAILPMLALTGCGSGEDVEASVLILQDSHIRWNGSDCTGAGALSEIREGASVTIYLSDGTETSELQGGVQTPEGNCRFNFDLSGVTSGRADFRVGSLPKVQGVITDNGRDHLWVTVGYD